MKRGLAAIVAIALLAVGVGVLAASHTTTTARFKAYAHPSRVIRSSGNDVSRPLRVLEGEAGGESSDPDRPDPDAGDPDKAAGDAAERDGAYVHRPFQRSYKAAELAKAHQADRALQAKATSAPTATMPAPITTFDGINSTQSGCGCYPPDTNAAVGPNDIVETVNTAIAVYDKSGNLRAGFPKPTNAIWSGFAAGPQCQNNNDGDPVVVYDRLADRFVVTQFAIPGFITGSGANYQCIAVSTTGDPTGSYNRYQFTYTSGLLNDYPKFGVWPDGYYATFNNFDNATGIFSGAGIAAYNRAAMLTGAPATVVQFNLPASTNEGGLLPSDLDGSTLPPAGAPNPIVEMQDTIAGFPQDQIMIRRFHVDFATPANSTLSAPSILATTPFDSNLCNFARNCIAQKGTGVKVDAISDRVMFRAAYRNFGANDSLLINATVDATGADVAGVRWAEVAGATGTTPSIVQQSTYSPDTTNRWMASIAQDKFGNIAMGYSASSTAVKPSLRYVGRLAGDPLGQMTQGESTLFAGTGSQTGSAGRWGDYSSLVLDPTDDCTFWYSNEYYLANGATSWRTRIGSFRFPACGGVSQPSLSINDLAVAEGNSGTKTLSFTITLSSASASTVTVHYATSNGSATAGSDYVAKSGNASFSPGALTRHVSVVVNGDTTPEIDETFNVDLSTPANATIADGQGIGTIQNDDGAVGPTLSINDVAIAEGNSGTKTLSFTITLSAASASTVTVNYATADGSATAGSDYVAKSGSATFAPGTALTRHVVVTINGDTTIEGNETFFVNLSGASGATIADSQGIGTITNDD